MTGVTGQIPRSRYPVQDIHEPRLKVKDENVGWKHTCSACSHAGFERIGSRSGYNPVQDIYILQRPSSCDPHFRYSEFIPRSTTPIYGFAVIRQVESYLNFLKPTYREAT
jgi:hypothetical protein